MSLNESLSDDIFHSAAATSEDLVDPQAGIRRNTGKVLVRARNNTSHMRTMASAVHWVIIRYVLATNLIVIANEIIPTLNLEAGSEASSEGRVKVVDTGIDNGYDNALTGVAQLVNLVDVGERVWVPFGERLRHDVGGVGLHRRDDGDGP